MAGQADSNRIPLVTLGTPTWSSVRRGEPVVVGVPLPAGAVAPGTGIAIEDEAGREDPLQARPLDLWPDGSVRWMLLDVRADSDRPLFLRIGEPAAAFPDGFETAESATGLRITTGALNAEFAIGGAFPVSAAILGGEPVLDAARSGLSLEIDGTVHRFCIAEARLEERGPLRSVVRARGVSNVTPCPVEVSARVELFANTAVLRTSITIHNPGRAEHAGGHWPLGDRGSVMFDRLILHLAPHAPVESARAAVEWNASLEAAALPFEIHQESSGGENWKSGVHRDHRGQIAPKFRGYVRRDGTSERPGLRASPIVVASTSRTSLTVAVPEFWQNCPRAIRVDRSGLSLGLHPHRPGDLHELQAGERKTHTFAIALAGDEVTDLPLAWIHDPLLLYPPPAWCCATNALPWLVPASDDRSSRYLALVAEAFGDETGFAAKREAQDEFGWRHYGDIPADHESAFLPPGQSFVSHYNNQYDAIAAFGMHFLRTGDRRWWRLMDDLARHVSDIDIYHTDRDRAAYNGGLFWHTLHYADAGTSSHRSYPRGHAASGGPANEHNYNAGLLLHYFMTGDPGSREGALSLAEWVLAMDDGRRSAFRWFDRNPTGLASSSGSPDYHGPGRGAGNSLLACLTGYRLTGDERFRSMMETLIQRCIHPRDDIAARDLGNIELRWSYTVFLQALGFYLQDKLERGELDRMFLYARDSLLHYARWMAANDRPYLERPDLLEFVTETWAAQDLRKADVFLWGARHSAEPERSLFLERARFFRDASLVRLSEMPTRHYARPQVLVLANGPRLGWLERAEFLPIIESGPATWPEPPAPFVPQRARAVKRVIWSAVVLGAAAAAMAGAWAM